MLKEAIEKIVSLATPETYVIDGQTYTSARLSHVTPYIDRPERTDFTSLDGIVKAVKTEFGRVTLPVFVQIDRHNSVSVYTTFRGDIMSRDVLYRAQAELPDRLPEWMGHDSAMIALRSRFIETTDTAYIIELLSSISDENSVKTTDNGLTQTVNVKQGVSLQQKAAIKPRVVLRPFRTFLEIDQPASEFLLRMRPGDSERGKEAQIGLIEADGGAWKLDAKHNIAAYFMEHLSELIKEGKVVVAE